MYERWIVKVVFRARWMGQGGLDPFGFDLSALATLGGVLCQCIFHSERRQFNSNTPEERKYALFSAKPLPGLTLEAGYNFPVPRVYRSRKPRQRSLYDE
jgi:hypothetical protein